MFLEELNKVAFNDLVTESFVEWTDVGNEGRGKEHITVDNLQICLELNDGVSPSTLLRSEG